ncbi:MAG: GNAT family N-acetyltransferase [Thermomicrobiales bacterium]|nr:GNAT family N-acetyltransferase [Thermomicrobiales bacterium]MCO5220983.1 GNAT family N-acetyltransferase [Thermomicrobiales bacterium]
MPGPSNRTIRTFRAADAEPLATLLRNSLATGEQSGHTASDFESLIGAFPIVRHLLVAELDDAPVGIISPDHRLLLVHPDVRRRGIGRALVEAAEDEIASSPDGPVVLFPPHGSEGAIAFLEAIGYAYDHSFWRFGLDPELPSPLPELPDDLSVGHYTDTEILPYIDLINTSFRGHPTPLRVTREQIEHVHGKASFDPASIAILRNESGDLIGFCTTSIDRDATPPVGHINLVGVLNEHRGRGLGRWLLLWGIHRLQSQGIDQIELSVDAENENAVGLYRSVGFDPVEEWPQWIRVGACVLGPES